MGDEELSAELRVIGAQESLHLPSFLEELVERNRHAGHHSKQCKQWMSVEVLGMALVRGAPRGRQLEKIRRVWAFAVLLAQSRPRFSRALRGTMKQARISKR